MGIICGYDMQYNVWMSLLCFSVISQAYEKLEVEIGIIYLGAISSSSSWSGYGVIIDGTVFVIFPTFEVSI